VIDLEQGLRDLGEHLDHPTGDQIVPQLRDRLSAPTAPPVHPRWRHRPGVMVVAGSLAAAVLLVAVVAVITFGSDSRDAPQARRPSGSNDHPTKTTTSAPPPAVLTVDLAGARAAVEFPIGVPGPSGVLPTTVTVDRRVPGGLVALEYPDFRVVEVASPPDAAANLAPTIAAEGEVQVMSVRGRFALWITGTHHDVPFFDRDGALRRTATRPTGHVLLWEEGGVTYRVEGFENEASARAMANSIS
jgi:hypothetical protein